MDSRKQPSVSLKHRDGHLPHATIERIENAAGRAIGWNLCMGWTLGRAGTVDRFRSFQDALNEAFRRRFIHPVPTKYDGHRPRLTVAHGTDFSYDD